MESMGMGGGGGGWGVPKVKQNESNWKGSQVQV